MDSVWGEWSEWVWDDNQARYWRARQDAQGNIEYDFHDPNAHAQAAPRGNVGNITDTLSNFTLGDDHGASYTDDNAYTTGAGAVAGATMYSAQAHSAHVHAQASHLAKGKSRAVNPQPKQKSRNQKDPAKDNLGKHPSKKRPKPAKNDVEDAASGHPPFYTKTDAVSPSDYVSGASSAPFQHQSYSDSAYGSSPHDPSYVSGFSQSPGAGRFFDQDSTVHSNADGQIDDPERYSHHGQTSDPGTGYSRPSDSEDPPAEEDQQSAYYSTGPQDSVPQDAHPGAQVHDTLSLADPYSTGAPDASFSGGESSSMATAHSYQYSAYAADGGRDTPRPFHQQAATTTAAEDYSYQTTMSEVQDFGQDLGGQEGYVVEHSSKFRPGSIFKILWCEPLGAGTPKSEAPTHHFEVRRNGRTFYQGYRRFIVVANDEGHCTCVPILTYERQACNKRGVKPAKHGIIYQTGKSPRKLPGEPNLGFDPVRAVLSERTEQLVKESRVNYAKLTTVEHNFPVYFIGTVHPDDFKHIVVPAVDYCWEKKKRHNY